MKCKTVYTDEFKQGIINEYIMGISIAKISEEYHISPNKCYLLLYENSINLRDRKELKLAERNPQWKGNNVSKTSALHAWVRRNKPKPSFCDNCKKVVPYDLANTSGLYKRDINDFEWLCRKCHMNKDGRVNNLKQNQQYNILIGVKRLQE